MKILIVVDSTPVEEFKNESQVQEILDTLGKDAEIKFVQDTLMDEDDYGYVDRMEKEGPEWIEPQERGDGRTSGHRYFISTLALREQENDRCRKEPEVYRSYAKWAGACKCGICKRKRNCGKEQSGKTCQFGRRSCPGIYD